MARRRLTGRLEAGRKALLDASEKALISGERVIRLKCQDKQFATSLRQACYSYQRSWIVMLEDQAIMEGKDPDLMIRKTLLTASWPSASIRYETRAGEHWLIFEFKRIPTDPSWDDMMRDNMFAGPFPEEPKANKDELIALEKKHD